MHVRITREQAVRLAAVMQKDDIELAELTNGKDGRLSASAIETVEKRKRLALSIRPDIEAQDHGLDTALGSRAAARA